MNFSLCCGGGKRFDLNDHNQLSPMQRSSSDKNIKDHQQCWPRLNSLIYRWSFPRLEKKTLGYVSRIEMVGKNQKIFFSGIFWIFFFFWNHLIALRRQWMEWCNEWVEHSNSTSIHEIWICPKSPESNFPIENNII